MAAFDDQYLNDDGTPRTRFVVRPLPPNGALTFDDFVLPVGAGRVPSADVFVTGAAPFGFAGPGSLSFNPSADQSAAAIRSPVAAPLLSNGALTFKDLISPESIANSWPGQRRHAESFDNVSTQSPSPEQLARVSLAKGLAERRNNDDEIYRTMAFRDNGNRVPATAYDEMWSTATNGWSDRYSAAKRAGMDALLHRENPVDAYRRELATERDWLAQRKTPPIAAGSVQAARDQLAEQLAAGKNNDDQILRAVAFRSNRGVPPAGAKDALMDGLMLHSSDEVTSAIFAPIDMILYGQSYGDAYRHHLAADRDRLEQYQKTYPRRALLADLLGSGLTSSLLGESVPAYERFLPKLAIARDVLKRAVHNGYKNAFSESASSEGDLEDRFRRGMSGFGNGLISSVRNSAFGHAWPAIKRMLQ